MAARKNIDWDAHRREYVTSLCSLRDIWEKYGINATTVKRKCREQGWVAERKEWRRKSFDRAMEQDQGKLAESLGKVETRQLDDISILLEELHATLDEVKRARETATMALQDRATLLKDLASALQTAVRTERLVTGHDWEADTDAWRRVLSDLGVGGDGNGDGRRRAPPLDSQVAN